MATQLNPTNLGAALVGADGGRRKYKPDPRPGRVFDKAAVDKSFEALKTFDWGSDYDQIQAIDDAAKITHGDAAVHKELETQLAAVLKTNASRAAKDFSCRMLSEIGSTASVPTLGELLTDKDLSHMARYALERISGAESAKVLRDTLPKTELPIKAGIIESIGAVRDVLSVDPLTALSSDSDKVIAFAAINALGKIGTAEAAKSLTDIIKKAPDDLKQISADAALVCAERLLAEGKKAPALALYTSISGEDQPKNIRMAAMRGRLAASAKKD
jgi:HEAT repeat protein